MIGVSADYAFEQSDHACVKIDLNIPVEIQVGPGLQRINPEILSDPMALLAVISAMNEMLGKIPPDWDPP